MNPPFFDVLIIGAGQAGPTLAVSLANSGWRIGLAERKHVGGLNAGAPYQAIRDAVHIHPTLAEAVQSAVSALD